MGGKKSFTKSFLNSRNHLLILHVFSHLVLTMILSMIYWHHLRYIKETETQGVEMI